MPGVAGCSAVRSSLKTSRLTTVPTIRALDHELASEASADDRAGNGPCVSAGIRRTIRDQHVSCQARFGVLQTISWAAFRQSSDCQQYGASSARAASAEHQTFQTFLDRMLWSVYRGWALPPDSFTDIVGRPRQSRSNFMGRLTSSSTPPDRSILIIVWTHHPSGEPGYDRDIQGAAPRQSVGPLGPI